MQNDPFAHIPVAPRQAPAAQPTAPAPVQPNRRVIGGIPTSEIRAQEDQRLQVEATNRQAAVEAERLRLAREEAQRADAKFQQEQQDRDQRGGASTTEAEKTAAFLGTRVANGLRTLSNIKGGQSPEWDAETARSLFGDTAANFLTSEDRQRVETAQRDVLDAALTLGTGAAYTAEQLEGYRRSYFPQLGDTEANIADKKQALKVLLEAARVKAGAAAPAIDEALAAVYGGETAGGGNTGAANAKLEDAFNNGASKEELLVLARQLGASLPEPAQLDAAIQYREAGGKGVNFFSLETPPPPPPAGNDPAAPDPLASKTFGEFGRFMNAFGQVSGDTFGIGDEMAGVGGAIGAVLRGEDMSQGYDEAVARDKARSAAAEEYMGNWTLPIQLLTGGAGGKAVSGVSAGLNAARTIAGTGAPVTRSAIQSTLTRRAAGSGAAIGGATGAAQGDTLEQRGTNALLGTTFGAVLGGGGQSISNRLGNRALAAAPAANPGTGVQQAADNLGVDVIPAVTGGTTTRMLTSGAKQGFISARPIDKAIDRMEGQALAARENIADNIGPRLDPEDAGNVIRTAGNVFSERTGRIGGKLYDRVERLGNGQKFPLTEGVKKADEWLADVGRSVQGKDGKIYSEIKKLRDSMASGDFDVMSIPRTRDEFRALLQETNLRGTTLDTAVKQILREAEGDILNGLVQSGNTRAAQAFKTASEFWAKRVETIDDFFNPILGKNAPRSGEQVVSAMERLANPKTGNASQLVGIMKAMPPREAASVRATIINRMGRATAGSANNLDDATFSFDTFMTNWNNMSPRAKAAMFPPEHRQALNDLATLSRAVKEAGSSANRSNTAGAVTVQAAISAPQLYFLEPLTAVGLAGGQYAVGRLLASPKFARVLARAPRQNTPQARQAFSQQLSGLARTEPALARELGVYQRALTANDNNAVGTLAAEQEDQQPAN
jgi:hypothetical protein